MVSVPLTIFVIAKINECIIQDADKSMKENGVEDRMGGIGDYSKNDTP
jgi:hypothetical protein